MLMKSDELWHCPNSYLKTRDIAHAFVSTGLHVACY